MKYLKFLRLFENESIQGLGIDGPLGVGHQDSSPLMMVSEPQNSGEEGRKRLLGQQEHGQLKNAFKTEPLILVEVARNGENSHCHCA